MAGMAIAIPGVLHISKTGYTIGKIRWHRGKKQEKMAKITFHLGKRNRCLHPCHPCQSGPMPPLFSSHCSAIFALCWDWQDSLTQKNGLSAWQNNRIGWIWPPPERFFFGRTGLSFGRKKLLAPPKKWPRNAYGQWERGLPSITRLQLFIGTKFNRYDIHIVSNMKDGRILPFLSIILLQAAA